MENFVLPIFAAIRRNWTKNGQKQDGIRTEKMPENGAAGQGFWTQKRKSPAKK